VQRRLITTTYDNDNADSGGEGYSDRKSAERSSNSEREDEEFDDEDDEDDEDEELAQEEDSDEEEDGIDEAKEQSQQQEAIVKGAQSQNLLLDPVRDSIQGTREKADTPANQAIVGAIERKQSFPDPGQESRDAHAENTASETLRQMASQALQMEILTEQSLQLRTELSDPDHRRREMNGNYITTSGEHKSHGLYSGQLDDSDGSWGPSIPETCGLAMEVDEDIVNSPTPAPSQNCQTIHSRSLRRCSGLGSQQLTIVLSCRNSPIPEHKD
jgi:hypothetical protein